MPRFEQQVDSPTDGGGEGVVPLHRLGTYVSAGEQALLKLLPCTQSGSEKGELWPNCNVDGLITSGV